MVFGVYCGDTTGCSQLNVLGTAGGDVVRVFDSPHHHIWQAESEGDIHAASGLCDQRGPMIAKCRRPVGARVSGLLFGGDDTARFNVTWPLHYLFGGGGADTLVGGSKHDKIRGGSGNDTIKGRGGKDRLYGNVGDDRLEADDGRADRGIDCGPGNDIAIVDPEDPPARHCETVKVRR